MRCAPYAFAYLASGLMFACSARGQSPGFEAASVKSVPLDAHYLPKEIPPGSVNPQRFRTRAQAERLIEWAYGIRDFQIAGGPKWIHDGSVRYEILATSLKPATEAEMRLMLRALLAERFGLIWHSERKEMSVFNLTVGRNGPKLTASKAGLRTGEGTLDIGQGGLIGRAVSIAKLVQILTENMDRPVIDKTGLAGRYDLDLHYDPGSLVDWRLAPVLPSLMQDLGLRLERAREQVDLLAIDSIVRPSEN